MKKTKLNIHLQGHKADLKRQSEIKKKPAKRLTKNKNNFILKEECKIIKENGW